MAESVGSDWFPTHRWIAFSWKTVGPFHSLRKGLDSRFVSSSPFVWCCEATDEFSGAGRTKWCIVYANKLFLASCRYPSKQIPSPCWLMLPFRDRTLIILFSIFKSLSYRRRCIQGKLLRKFYLPRDIKFNCVHSTSRLDTSTGVQTCVCIQSARLQLASLRSRQSMTPQSRAWEHFGGIIKFVQDFPM